MAVSVPGQGRAARDREVPDLHKLLAIKEDFFRLAVHELRRPLALARGYLSMIGDGTCDVQPEIRQSLDQVVIAHREMEALLEDLAALIRLEDGGAVLRVRPVRLGEVIASAVEATAEEAARKGATRIDQEVEDPGLQFPGDVERLRIAIVNLIGNAIKYGPEGSVVLVRGYRRAREVAISVTDEGPGVDPAEAGVIFEALRRGRGAGPTGGMGLGLSIVRRIAELHDGQVTVESPPGRGATFTLYLPTPVVER